MKRLLVLIIAVFTLTVLTPFQIFATTSGDKQAKGMTDTISIIEPGNGLKAAKGDGTDETAVIQAIFDYAVKHHKTILIPEGYTFLVDHLVIDGESDFSILGYGTLKHKNNARRGILTIDHSSNFTIETLNTDGNVEGNMKDGERVNQFLYSLGIYRSTDFEIGIVNDINPAGDSVYLNDVKNVTIGTIIGKADKACGRNVLSIIKAQDVTIDKVIGLNIGHPTMPGGIDLEPNDNTDHIQNVVIKSAEIRTSGNFGCAVGNGANAIVKDIEINAVVTRFGNPESSVFVLQNVENFKGDIKIYQEGKERAVGASITASNQVNVNLEIYNATLGLGLGKNSKNINLKGRIIGTTEDGIAMWDGVKQGVIDMEIKQVGARSDVVRVSSGKVEDLTFRGDYSFDKSGQYCFRIDGEMKNCRTENLKANGWNIGKLITGDFSKNAIAQLF